MQQTICIRSCFTCSKVEVKLPVSNYQLTTANRANHHFFRSRILKDPCKSSAELKKTALLATISRRQKTHKLYTGLYGFFMGFLRVIYGFQKTGVFPQFYIYGYLRVFYGFCTGNLWVFLKDLIYCHSRSFFSIIMAKKGKKSNTFQFWNHQKSKQNGRIVGNCTKLSAYLGGSLGTNLFQ